ncbi:unnamed protein product [Vicia faba]|uniref:Uncharacterized protein n=1 Tax=Vicia faba TaxID=3906 RepID=A0AAV0ZX99_VICFA|nr:unnamed protein product [Vicia faba]
MSRLDRFLVGGRFTWYKGNDKAMSRLDRFLVSRKLIEEWRVVDQRVEFRDISDYSPIRLNIEKIDWGPKPFRFKNAWYKHEEWAKLKVEGRGDFILYEKLKSLKHRLKEWNCDVFGWINLKVSEEVGNLNKLDKLLVENHGGNVDPLVNNRREVTKELWNWLNVKESMLRLKFIQLWLKDGDKNTRFSIIF